MRGSDSDNSPAARRSAPLGRENCINVYVIADAAGAPHKAGEARLYVMYDAADPDGGKLYFTEAEWEAFVLGVKDGEFDLDESGNLP